MIFRYENKTIRFIIGNKLLNQKCRLAHILDEKTEKVEVAVAYDKLGFVLKDENLQKRVE